jgi:hypothetical protein
MDNFTFSRKYVKINCCGLIEGVTEKDDEWSQWGLYELTWREFMESFPVVISLQILHLKLNTLLCDVEPGTISSIFRRNILPTSASWKSRLSKQKTEVSPCLLFLSCWLIARLALRPWRWKQYISPTRQFYRSTVGHIAEGRLLQCSGYLLR